MSVRGWLRMHTATSTPWNPVRFLMYDDIRVTDQNSPMNPDLDLVFLLPPCGLPGAHRWGLLHRCACLVSPPRGGRSSRPELAHVPCMLGGRRPARCKARTQPRILVR